MDDQTILCRQGDTCRFIAHIGDGTNPLATRYDKARFVVKDAGEVTGISLIDVNETNGISFDYVNSQVIVALGAQLTGSVSLPLPRKVFSQLRLYNSSDINDRISWAIDFVFLPSGIPNV